MNPENLQQPLTAGHQLADQIARDIVEAELSPGAVMDSLEALSKRYRTGHPVLMQALRILESRGVAKVRRGVNGGLVVKERSPGFASRGLSILIEHDMRDMMEIGVLPVSIDHQLYLEEVPSLSLEACNELLQLAHRLDRLNDDDFMRLGAHRQLFNAIRLVSAEPTLNLAQLTSFECAVDMIPYSVSVLGESKAHPSWQLSLAVVEAIVGADIGRLFEYLPRQINFFKESWDTWEEINRTPILNPKMGDLSRPEFKESTSRADRLTREILREVRHHNWEYGARIGSGVELMERYQTSPNILRQAVLMLQDHGVVTATKGRSGGIVITEPNREATILEAQSYLKYAGATTTRMTRFLQNLVLQAFDGFPQTSPQRLARNAIAAREYLKYCDATGAPIDYWRFTELVCQNPVLSIMQAVILPLLTGTNGGSEHFYAEKSVGVRRNSAGYWQLLESIEKENISSARRILGQLSPANLVVR